MSLSNLLLICAVATGLFAAFGARYRSVGTQLRDIGMALLIAVLSTVLLIVVLTLVVGLDLFGIIHLVYLLIVVGFPVAVTIVVVPHYLDREYRTPLLAHLLALLAIAAGLFGYWGTHVEPFRLRVDRQALGATGAVRPVVVGVLADLQTGSIGDHERKAVANILAADPDLIVVPGDLYQFEEGMFAERAPEFVGIVRQMTDAVDHVVIVGGDSDDPEGLSLIAEDSGALFLDDELIDLDLGDGQTITLVGVNTPLEDEDPMVDPNVRDVLEASYGEDDLILVVSHRPDVVLTFEPDAPIDLTISGHTHGGQVSLPGIGPLVTFSSVPRIVAAGGLHSVDGHPVYVSTGVGLERLQAPQLRFGVRPSVGIITIVPN